ncbi:SusC/RagA family TonB-linked outer membrane protein [Persicobacter psychrovividus]|uniref:SusC/RagA family TonB-linked outer membrane protein n=2 Tax=Persicobacter psychrovividus TaxID=387638 RepID=A0ABM7VC85_9BACT|nr:SusC/RagA family TonB-linked outer membrane protein [Persicobacter psychrovividus]
MGFMAGSAFAQSFTVKGIVKDETSFALPGVSVLVNGSTIGTVTDFNGAYTIEVPEGMETLTFSYVGFKTQHLQIQNRSEINPILKTDNVMLDQIVVTGYGEQKKSHLTGAIAKLENTNLEQIPVPRVDQALYGKLAGVQIQTTDGDAGATPYIQIRGQATINAGSGPLIVVDGFPIPDDLSAVDMNDVASIEVLKDAASAAIYGSRGANGVILITTKTGKKGKMKVSFTSNMSVKTPALGYDLDNPNSWADYALNKPNLSETDKEKILFAQQLGHNYDAMEEMTRAGFSQNYQINLSGGSENTSYYISGQAMDDEGVVEGNNFRKYSLRVKVDTKLNERFKVGVNMNGSLQQRDVIETRMHDVGRSASWMPSFHTPETSAMTGYPVGSWTMEEHFRPSANPIYGDQGYPDIRNTSNVNGYAKLVGRPKDEQTVRMYVNAYAAYQITDDLEFRSTGGVYYTNFQRNYFQTSYGHRNGAPEALYLNQNTFNFLNENILNYKKKIGDHEISAMGGFTIQTNKVNSLGTGANGFLNDKIQLPSAATNTWVVQDDTYETQNNLVSTLARVNYAFRNKYLLSVSSRWDGSSRFGANNRWGYFPAVSVGWRLMEEPFMAQFREVVSELKLTSSYGATGNNAIGDYLHIGNMASGNYVTGSDNVVPGYVLNNKSNPDLGWERTFEYNGGVNIGLFENRVYLGVQYYSSTTDQLLLNMDIPSMSGFETLWVNHGKVRNSGVEIELTTRNIVKDDFSWETTATLTTTKNEVLNFGQHDSFQSTTESKRPNHFLTQVGSPISQFYGYRVKRELTDEEFGLYWPIGLQANNVYAQDLNGDGVIDENDMEVLGKANPDFVWGLTNTVRYKQFDLSFTFQGSHGASVFNIDDHYLQTHWAGTNDKIGLDDPDGLTVRKTETDWHVQDASYVALRNLNFGYTFPLQSEHIRNLRVFFAGSNLLYLTSSEYTGLNPEGINANTESAYTRGYQRGPMPLAKSFSLGVKLDF